MKLHEKITRLREAKGLSQKEVAAALNLQYPTYNKYETGGSKPTYETLVEIARFYGCTTDFILGAEEAMTRDRADISTRTGLSEGAIRVLEESRADSWQRDKPIIRALNDLITQTAGMEQHLLYLIALYLYYDLSGETPFRTTSGDPVHTVDLMYHDNEKSRTVYTSTLKMNARDIVGMKILDALRDLSQKTDKEAEQ